MMDRSWLEAIGFLSDNPSLLARTLGPSAIKKHLPEIISFDSKIDISEIAQVVFHKGTLATISDRVLAAGFGRADAVFSNEVFVVYRMTDSDIDHVRAFEVALIKHIKEKSKWDNEVASNGPAPLLRRPLVNKARNIRVVVAFQAPTLLNIWASSSKWTLEVADLGDHAGLQEATLLSTPRWNQEIDDVSAVLVTSPLQLENAQRLFPDAAHIWIIHNGQADLLPKEHLPSIDGIIVLSYKVLLLQQTHMPELLRKPAWIIPPSYLALKSYRWTRETVWTMKSRPAQRGQYSMQLFGQTAELLSMKGLTLTMYGQGAPGGFLDDAAKADLYQHCSCYVTTLPPWAGFGLAEHECLAAGVPLAGLLWGDLNLELAGRYTTLTDNLDGVCEQALRLSSDEYYANEISQSGLDYISTARSKRSMDESISKFIDEVKKL